MKAASFDYLRVTSIDEACRVLADSRTDARIIAGGQTLVPLMAMRLMMLQVDFLKLILRGSFRRMRVVLYRIYSVSILVLTVRLKTILLRFRFLMWKLLFLRFLPLL